ncbi:hypothetical protein HW452_00205 [Halomonas aquamarina]|uniref:Uncharacterized protein n=1 Tax=Vreelandella aquamarina TaxID=77097 RepID=A0ACC5VP30_9GAMM|nr:I78 family peptidase inhibitor [Halomonas aquamarina]MBZ5485951.1 hypothetical protein [Halomonas aquamarina]
MTTWHYITMCGAVRYSTMLVAGGAILLLGACATGVEDSFAGEQAAQPVSLEMCDAAAVDYALGEIFDEANLPQLQSESQSRQVRVLHPGDAATMDHRPERLNIHVDDDERIEALRCG